MSSVLAATSQHGSSPYPTLHAPLQQLKGAIPQLLPRWQQRLPCQHLTGATRTVKLTMRLKIPSQSHQILGLSCKQPLDHAIGVSYIPARPKALAEPTRTFLLCPARRHRAPRQRIPLHPRPPCHRYKSVETYHCLLLHKLHQRAHTHLPPRHTAGASQLYSHLPRRRTPQHGHAAGEQIRGARLRPESTSNK